jgi:hypothetical protein
MKTELRSATCFQAGVFLNLFNPEDRGDNSSETLVDFQRTTRRYIPEDSSMFGFLNQHQSY